ncbi:MAG: organoarsenical effux MFS transporter ArsJ [Sneathiella sp.]|nr:organoarsenical effux MFS transporter ArsJ [Sneathiella sp.]
MSSLKNYAIVTASYWGFTVTDGALRMLVLLHFHALGFTPLDLAFLFLLYEAMGIVTNFFGGWIGARFGLRLTLFTGLLTQIISLCLLAALPDNLTLTLSVVYVMGAQALSGVAKDLTKMSSKSAIKHVVPEGQPGGLFKWVSLLTGSKNALKGVGFFVGGFLLNAIGFEPSLLTMAAALLVILLFALLSLREEIGKATSKIRGKDLFSKSANVNYLSAARVFLFASRDVWFVVGVPVFLAGTLGWNFNEVGSFMAFWVIGYGIVQASVPSVLRNTKTSAKAIRATIIWGFILCLLPLHIAAGMTDGGAAFITENLSHLDQGSWLIGGLIIFGAVFAVNSALHSYLIVDFSGADKVSLNIGFYYMSNAFGRLAGTLLSGLVYQYYGLTACLVVSAAMIAAAVLLTLPLRQETRHE